MAGGDHNGRQKCLMYGRFMHHLSRDAAEGVFWSMFVGVILLLWIAASAWARSEFLASELQKRSQALELSLELESISDLDEERQRVKKKQTGCVLISSACAFLATVATVMGAFGGLTLQYCHQEHLMNFYWGFWTLIEVGSLIAILGIAAKNGLLQKHHPPWSVALGTPVLVIAGFGHFFTISYGKIKRNIKRKPQETKDLPHRPYEVPSGAKLIGFSGCRSPIIDFPRRQEMPHLPPYATLLGFNAEGGPIVKYQILPSTQGTRVLTRETTLADDDNIAHEKPPEGNTTT